MSPLPLLETHKKTVSHQTIQAARLAAAVLALAVVFFTAKLVISQAGDRRTEPPQRVLLINAELPPLPEPIEELEFTEPETKEDTVDIESDNEIDDPTDAANDMLDDFLGLDTAGVAGGDAFGLKAKPRGHGLLDGGGSSNPMQRYADYFKSIELDLQRLLENRKELRNSYYKIALKIWISSDGSIENCEIDQSTGDTELESRIVRLIKRSKLSVEQPPVALPQPIRLLVSSIAPDALAEPLGL